MSVEPLADEERARADAYALVSRLFYAPPDTALLRELGRAAPQFAAGDSDRDERPADDYARAFRALQDACRDADAERVRQEYDDTFVGAGKAPVTPYTSTYALSHAPDRHLLALREQLARWSLTRREAVFELEDHAAALCDVMRWLIQKGSSLDEQRAFFERFVYTGLGAFCSAVQENEMTPFYKHVARFARAFLELEKKAFDLHAAE